MCKIREAKFQSSLKDNRATLVDDAKGMKDGKRNCAKFKQDMGVNTTVYTWTAMTLYFLSQ